MSKPIVAASIGLVGVRRGLSHAQFETLARMLVTQSGRGALAGVAVAHRSNDGWSGADFSRITRWMAKVPRLVVHDCGQTAPDPPPLTTESMTSWAEFSIEAITVPAWNREIVDESDLILACPPVADEEPRSRTWWTIRYARSLSKPVIVIDPDGSVDVGGQQHYLVKETTGRNSLWVFLCRDPKLDGYPGIGARPVMLETLPVHERIEAVRPVLGRSKHAETRYREFSTLKALHHSGFSPVGPYRICDNWEDYHFPWEGATLDAPETNDGIETNSEALLLNSVEKLAIQPVPFPEPEVCR